MDLPVWQALYEELAPRNFTVVTVAMDAGGAQDVRQWIEAAKPTHPSLIDTRHVVAELYDWVNVPSNAWIDEEGRIVRPNDPGFAGEYFRGMMEPGFDFKAMMKEYARMRDRYLEAVRDWVANGPGSRRALAHEQHACRVGSALTRRGELDAAHPTRTNHARPPARHALGEQARHQAPAPGAPEERQHDRSHARVGSKGDATAPGSSPQRRARCAARAGVHRSGRVVHHRGHESRPAVRP